MLLWVLGNLGPHEAYMDTGAALLIAALNFRPAFGQTAVFLLVTLCPLMGESFSRTRVLKKCDG